MIRTSRVSAAILCAALSFSGVWSTARAADIIPVPISYYAFNEANGSTTITDSIRGSAGLGTLYKTTGVTAGNFSTVDGRKSLRFDGSTWARMATAAGSSAFSITSWVKLDVVNQFATIVKNWGDPQVGSFQLGLGYNSPYKWSTYVGYTNNTFTDIEAGSSASSGQWYNVASTYSDVNNELKLYVNGSLIQTVAATGGAVQQNSPWMSFGVKLNNAYDGPATAFQGWLTGYLSDVAFWDVALTQGQITSIYGGSPIPVPEPSTYALAGISAIAVWVVAHKRRRNALKPVV